jgi:hypothetical protein
MEDHTQDNTRNYATLTREMVTLVITVMEETITTTMEEAVTITMVVMDIITTKEMATTIMDTKVIITTLGELMVITMAETITMLPREISTKWSALNATRQGITPIIAPRTRRRTTPTSPILFRRDMLITSMWKKF